MLLAAIGAVLVLAIWAYREVAASGYGPLVLALAFGAAAAWLFFKARRGLDGLERGHNMAGVRLKKHPALRRLDLRLPESPLDETVEAESDSSGRRYTVDIGALTCSCPDAEKRAHIKGFARCCKHLMRELSRRGLLAGAWEQAVAAEGHGAPFCTWELFLESGPSALVATGRSNEWVNVFVHTGRLSSLPGDSSDPIRCFGWNCEDGRWAYGRVPPCGNEITSVLSQSVAG